MSIARSMVPSLRSWARVSGFVYLVKTSSSTLGGPPQWCLLATQRTKTPLFHSTTWKGPEPTTGGVFAYAVTSFALLNLPQMCSGTIGTHIAVMSALEREQRITTVASSGAVTFSMPSRAER